VKFYVSLANSFTMGNNISHKTGKHSSHAPRSASLKPTKSKFSSKNQDSDDYFIPFETENLETENSKTRNTLKLTKSSTLTKSQSTTNDSEISCKFTQKQYFDYQKQFKRKFHSGISKLEFVIELSIATAIGNAKPFAELAFDIIDSDNSGTISDHEFLVIFSVIKYGSQQEILHLIWRLVDADEDGVVTKREMELVLKAVNEMIPMEGFDKNESKFQCDDIFRDLDVDDDGCIDLKEFLGLASKNKWITDVCSAFLKVESVLSN